MESIRRVNQTKKELAMAGLAEATLKLNSEKERLQYFEGLLQGQLDQDQEEQIQNISYYLQREKYLKRLRDNILFQKNNIKAATKVVENAKDKLQKAHIEVKKMDKACEIQKKKWSYESNREEQSLNDEIATTKHFFSVN
jgi:flagellar export protein FliJ